MTRRPPFATREVAALAASLTALLLVVAHRYGPHRDELYFVAAGHRPAWGYPDQPPLTPLLARLADTLAPGSLTVLRTPSALAAGLVVLLAAACARELGGERPAQLLAALAAAGSGVLFVVGHLLSTTTLDVPAWTALTWLVLRALVHGQARAWLAAGLVAGVGLENKDLVLLLLVALGVGLLADREGRRQVREPWLWAGAALALALWAPNLIWQVSAGWPQLELARDITDEYGALGERILFPVFALIAVSPVGFLLWGRGLAGTFRDPRLVRARPLGVAYAVLFVFLLVAGGKGYYLAGLYPVLGAAGAVLVRRARLWAVALAVAAVPGLFIGLPLLPAATWAASPLSGASDEQLETIGWPEFAGAVRAGLAAAPPDAVVFTGNYGEAGAVEWYGVSPVAYSGHNGFGRWGPPPQDDAPVVLVGEPEGATVFPGCRDVAVVTNRADADNEESGVHVRVCRAPEGGWARAWPDLVHLDA